MLDAKSLAKLIRESGWKDGQTIRLISCSTARSDSSASSLAKSLAELMLTDVIAPSMDIKFSYISPGYFAWPGHKDEYCCKFEDPKDLSTKGTWVRFPAPPKVIQVNIHPNPPPILTPPKPFPPIPFVPPVIDIDLPNF